MYILAGEKKGTILEAPKEGTRPTTNKIKKSLFDTIQPYLENARVLDLFAGSGQLGLEALSRGAAFATFVEKGHQAAQCIRKNITKLQFADKSKLIIGSVEQHLSQVKNHTLIFMDPPYDLNVNQIVETILSDLPLEALFVVEQSKRTPFLFPYNRKKEFGDTFLYFFSKTTSAD